MPDYHPEATLFRKHRNQTKRFFMHFDPADVFGIFVVFVIFVTFAIFVIFVIFVNLRRLRRPRRLRRRGDRRRFLMHVALADFFFILFAVVVVAIAAIIVVVLSPRNRKSCHRQSFAEPRPQSTPQISCPA